jgi:GTPase-activating protein SAC7
MTEDSPAFDGLLPSEEDEKTPALAGAKGFRRSLSFSNSIFDNVYQSAQPVHLPQRRHSCLFLHNPPQQMRQMRQKRSQSMLIHTPSLRSPSPSVKRDKFGRRRRSSLFITPLGNDSSEALGAGILPVQKRMLKQMLSQMLNL